MAVTETFRDQKTEDREQKTDKKNLSSKSLSSVFCLYDDETERKLHLNAVEMLAQRIGDSVEDVERVYEIVLRRFKKGAKVKDFLPILVSRRAEYLLNVRKNRRILNE
ncbi:MAG: hypothetical protein QMD44_09265 [Thermodesulfovibrionales bacterium]|jgi:hypothetical protein|nr:hypothetical protein [Thermodesulfovibrionales bacterium]